MFDLLQPKDENEVPHRFRGHREAFRWVVVSLARYGPQVIRAYVSAVAAWLVWSVTRYVFAGAPLDLFPPDWRFFVIVAVAFPLAVWILASGLIYVYLVLAGGVMRRDERERPFS